MLRLLLRKSQKAGLPPETLVYTGERKDEDVTIHVIDYDAENFHEQELSSVEDSLAYKEKQSISWINVEGVNDASVLEKFGKLFGLHRLVMEDIMNTDQRPKLEDYGDYLYLVLKMISSKNGGETVTEQLSVILGKDFVISFQEGIKGDVFDIIRERLRNNNGRIRKKGTDYLAYSLLDSVVDNYFVVLERIGDKIEDFEAELMENPTRETERKIHQLKRELLFLRNAVYPLREVVNSLLKTESPLVQESMTHYFRDVYDHVIHIIESFDIYREMITGLLEIYLSSVSNRLNEVMRLLMLIATIFMPLTFIVGLYGMNFRNMPELEWEYGYYAVLGLIALIGTGMVLYFRHKKWL